MSDTCGDGAVVVQADKVRSLPPLIDDGKGGLMLETPFEVTDLGVATYHSCLTPQEALLVHQQLAQARRCLVLTDELHLCYLMTPMFQLPTPNWTLFERVLDQALDDDTLIQVLLAVGGSRAAVRAHAQGSSVRLAPEKELALCRLYSALMLHDIVRERPMCEVAARYGVARGVLQSLMQSASAFAFMTVAFCKRMGWWDLELLLSGYVKRLNLGVKPDVLPLTEISGVGRARARALYNSGFRTVADVAMATPEVLAQYAQLGPFSAGVARKIVTNAKILLTKQARNMRKQVSEMAATAALARLPPVTLESSPKHAAYSSSSSSSSSTTASTSTTSTTASSSSSSTSMSSRSASMSLSGMFTPSPKANVSMIPETTPQQDKKLSGAEDEQDELLKSEAGDDNADEDEEEEEQLKFIRRNTSSSSHLARVAAAARARAQASPLSSSSGARAAKRRRSDAQRRRALDAEQRLWEQVLDDEEFEQEEYLPSV